MRANCIICSDLFDGINTIITTPCGHVFHEICCLQWLEHSSTCPGCRQKMNRKSMVRLYFNLGTDDVEESDCKLANELENLKANIKLKEMEKHKLLVDKEDLRKCVIKAENQADVNLQKYLDSHGELTAARLQLKQLVKEMSTLQNVADENKRLVNKLQHLKNVQSIIENCQGDVNTMLSSWGDGSLSTKETATYLTLLKRELQSSREARAKLANELRGLKYDLGLKSSNLKEVELELQETKSEMSFLRETLEALETSKDHKTPASSSKRKFTSPDANAKENIATPFKLPKMNMVSAVVNMVHDRHVPVQHPPQTVLSVPQTSLFRPQNSNDGNTDSVITEGYSGLGGHTKYISRSAPLKLKFTKVNKKPSSTKTLSKPTLDRFLSL